MARSVRLPNGAVIQNVPKDVTQDQIIQKAIDSGIATEQDFNIQSAPPQALDQTAQTAFAGFPGGVEMTQTSPVDVARSAGQTVVENLDIAGGFGGAVAGAKRGRPFGAKGILGGTVLGGALGTFGGSIASDELKGDDIDYAKATELSLLSVGIDAATLGAGKFLKPGVISLRNKMGFGPEETAEQIIKEIGREGGLAGSRESIAQSQRIFMEQGASFTPSQTGQATPFQVLGDRVARTGIFSQNVIDRNLREQSRIINDNMSDLFSDALTSPNVMGPSELGSMVFDAVQTGKLALQDSYVRGLDEISSIYGQRAVSKQPLLNEARQFLRDKSFAGGAATELDDTAVRQIERFISDLENAPASIDVDSLFKFEKTLQNRISQLSDRNSPGFNSQASAQISEFSSNIRQRTSDIFERVDPELNSRFLSLKRQYSTGLNELIPPVNRRMIENASSKNMFNAIGETIAGTGSPAQIEAFYTSLNRAFAEAKRGGRQLPYSSVQEIKDRVHEGFIAKHFSFGDKFDLRNYKNKAQFFEQPKNRDIAQAVLGEKFAPFKQLVNAMSEASTRPQSNLGELVIRGKEFGAGREIGGSLQLLGTGAAATQGFVGIAAAGAILTLPIFLAKAATNPRNVNKIIAFNKKRFGTEDALEVAGTNLVVDIFSSLPTEDQEEIRNYIKSLSNPEEQ